MGFELSLARSPQAVPRARHEARDWLLSHPRVWNADENLSLVVSELVSNAVVHGEDPIVLGLDECGDSICVEVSDGDPDSPSSFSERVGLLIVERLSRRVGMTRHAGDGKTTWAEVTA